MLLTSRWLFSPHEPAAYLDNVADARPLHIARTERDYYHDCLTETSFAAWLDRSDLRYPTVQLAKSGDYVSPSLFTYSATQEDAGEHVGIVDKEEIHSRFASASTIIINGFDRINPEFDQLCAALEREIFQRVSANVYWTPPGSCGFGLHHDRHNVLVLQIAGQKQWEIYDPTVETPKLDSERRNETDEDGREQIPPLMAIVLQPGELLYIPKGFPHKAAPLGERSLHVSIGLTPFTYRDLLQCLGQSLGEEISLTQILPTTVISSLTKGLPPDDEMLSAIGRSISTMLTGEVIHAALGTLVRERIKQTTPPVRNYFSDQLNSQGNEFDGKLRISSRLSILERRGDKTLLLANRKIFEIPKKYEDIVCEIMSKKVFRINELSGLPKTKRELLKFLRENKLLH